MKNLDHKISKWIYDRAHTSPVLSFLSIVGARYLIYVLGLLVLLITPNVFPLFAPISNSHIFGTIEIIGIIWFVTSVLQILVRRKRPFECKIYEAKIPLMCKTPSFPSSHASVAFALAALSLNYFSFWAPTMFHLDFLGFVLFTVFALWIALSRVAVGVHYVSDIVVGALIGFFLPWILIILAFTYGM